MKLPAPSFHSPIQQSETALGERSASDDQQEWCFCMVQFSRCKWVATQVRNWLGAHCLSLRCDWSRVSSTGSRGERSEISFLCKHRTSQESLAARIRCVRVGLAGMPPNTNIPTFSNHDFQHGRNCLADSNASGRSISGFVSSFGGEEQHTGLV